MKIMIFILLLSVLLVTASAQSTDKQWQAKAIQKYPALGIQGSGFNKLFLEEHAKRRKTNPLYFSNPQWPLLLADELSTTSSKPVPTPYLAPKEPPVWLSDKWKETRYIAFALLVLLVWIIISRSLKRLKAEQVWKQICRDSDAFHEEILQKRCFPIVSTHILLQSDERAFYHAPSALYETRAVRHYQSGFVGFRVAKGVYVGGSSGTSVSSQELTKIDSGTLTVTNKRLIFDGSSADRTIALSKLISVEPNRDSVEISVSTRQKGMLFAASNPLILSAIIRLSCEDWDTTSRFGNHIPIDDNRYA